MCRLDWPLFLEYLKVLLNNWPLMISIILVYLTRTFKSEISLWLKHLKVNYKDITVSSQHSMIESKLVEKKMIEQKETSIAVKAGEESDLEKQWKANAYLWEYRYLNYFLVYNTQLVLDWLYDQTAPISVIVADSVWIQKIPSSEERVVIIQALQQHHLVSVESEKLSITPKGREYVETRGRTPLLPKQ
jgi:hypothetical protein